MELNLSKYFDWIDKLPPLPLLALFTLVLGYALIRCEWFPNQSIMLAVLILGGIGYPLMQYGIMPMVLKGSIVTGGVWACRKFILKPLEKRIPWLKALLCGSKSNEPDDNGGGFDSDPRAFTRQRETKPLTSLTANQTEKETK